MKAKLCFMCERPASEDRPLKQMLVGKPDQYALCPECNDESEEMLAEFIQHELPELQRIQRAQQAESGPIRVYHSAALGPVTIPDD